MKNKGILLLVAVIVAFILGLGIQYKIGLLSDNQRQPEHLHGEEGAHAHDHGHEHGHDHGPNHGHDHGHNHSHEHEQNHGQDHGHDHGQEPAHDHGQEPAHDHGQDHGHGHGHGDEKSSQMTVFDEKIEVFLEHPFLVAGKGAEFVTHISYMQSGMPRAAGPVTFVMQHGQERPIEHVEKAPARDGIYIPTLTFPKPGQWKLALVMPTDAGQRRISLLDVTVYATQQQADAAPEQETPEGISFLKEEQWRWRTLTEFVSQMNIDGVQSLAIPEACIVYDGDETIVYVLVAGETVQRRPVTLGQARDGMIQVKSGLKAGERVISRSAYAIAQKELGDGAAGHAPHGEEPAGFVHLTDDVIERHQIVSSAVGSATMGRQISLYGQITLNADKVAHIVPVVSGVVRQVYRSKGDVVKKGDVLAWIDSRELADAKAAYLAASERYDMSRLAFEREETLWKQKITSEQDYLERKQAFTEARIEKRAAEQKLYAIGFDEAYLEKLAAEPEQFLTRYELKAPYDGTVLSRRLTQGEVIASYSDAFVIADMDTVWVDFRVHAKDLSLVKPGQKVVVTSETSAKGLESVLSLVSPVVDQSTRTGLARAVLTNESGAHRPGQFVQGAVFLEEIAVEVAVPASAIQYIDDVPCVFVRTGGGFEKRPVRLGRATKEYVEIVAGLKPNEEVVVRNAFLLKSEVDEAAGAYGGHGHPH